MNTEIYRQLLVDFDNSTADTCIMVHDQILEILSVASESEKKEMSRVWEEH